MQATELQDEIEQDGGHSLRQLVTTWDCLAQLKLLYTLAAPLRRRANMFQGAPHNPR